MRATILALILGALTLTSSHAQAIGHQVYDAESDMTQTISECSGDQRAEACGPLVLLTDAAPGERQGLLLLRVDLTSTSSGRTEHLTDVLDAIAGCDGCGSEVVIELIRPELARLVAMHAQNAEEQARQVFSQVWDDADVRQEFARVTSPGASWPARLVKAVRLAWKRRGG